MATAGSERAAGSAEDVVAAVCSRYGNRPDALLEILHDIQETVGWIAESVPAALATALNLTRADVHGVISFYHDFRRQPPARCMVRLCRAEACQAVGADPLAAELEQRLGVSSGETRADLAVGIETVYCLGNCALGPSAVVSGRLIGRASVDEVMRSVEAIWAEDAAR